MLAAIAPAEPEAHGLLALMELNASRAAALLVESHRAGEIAAAGVPGIAAEHAGKGGASAPHPETIHTPSKAVPSLIAGHLSGS